MIDVKSDEMRLVDSMTTLQWTFMAKLANRKYPLTLADKILLIRHLKTALEDKLERKIKILADKKSEI